MLLVYGQILLQPGTPTSYASMNALDNPLPRKHSPQAWNYEKIPPHQ